MNRTKDAPCRYGGKATPRNVACETAIDGGSIPWPNTGTGHNSTKLDLTKTNQQEQESKSKSKNEKKEDKDKGKAASTGLGKEGRRKEDERLARVLKKQFWIPEIWGTLFYTVREIGAGLGLLDVVFQTRSLSCRPVGPLGPSQTGCFPGFPVCFALTTVHSVRELLYGIRSLPLWVWLFHSCRGARPLVIPSGRQSPFLPGLRHPLGKSRPTPALPGILASLQEASDPESASGRRTTLVPLRHAIPKPSPPFSACFYLRFIRLTPFSNACSFGCLFVTSY